MLIFDPDAPPLSGEALEQLMRDFLAVHLTNLRLSKRYDPLFLEQLIDFQRYSTDWNKKDISAWSELMAAKLKEKSATSIHYELEVIKGEEGHDLLLKKAIHGVVEEKRITPDFFLGPEYRLIGKLADTLNGLIQPEASVRRGKSVKQVSSFREVYEWLMAESRKGRSIQRFKGLGEMNPEQLWDTTVNPETRRLLQVTIEDAVAADEVFTTLMGDEVEPRRDFIEKNAMYVSNLDI
jgi:DNA gyrase subunit B